MKPLGRKGAGGRSATLEVRVQPGARVNGIVGFNGQELHVRVKAPPREGAANKALVALIAAALHIPGRAVSVVRGHTSRKKVIYIDGLSIDEVRDRLASTRSGGNTART
jgi:uncharacterized protein (TIGR00251 family)